VLTGCDRFLGVTNLGNGMIRVVDIHHLLPLVAAERGKRQPASTSSSIDHLVVGNRQKSRSDAHSRLGIHSVRLRLQQRQATSRTAASADQYSSAYLGGDDVSNELRGQQKELVLIVRVLNELAQGCRVRRCPAQQG
jgi:hypothetical protein